MTDKEMAIDWIRSQGWNEENLPSDELLQMEEAFLAGLKAGRPQWHDLEKKLKTSLDYNKSLLNALKNCGASRLNSGLIERAESFIKEAK